MYFGTLISLTEPFENPPQLTHTRNMIPSQQSSVATVYAKRIQSTARVNNVAKREDSPPFVPLECLHVDPIFLRAFFSTIVLTAKPLIHPIFDHKVSRFLTFNAFSELDE